MTDRITRLRDDLIAWFERHQRDLPWRRRRDAYAVWLSEVMLQQTQVVTVVPYFERFLARFPTIADLAAAELDEVLSMWSGLGYYARARNLHRAAGIMAQGGIPTRAVELRALPGLGPYTAAAIASFAFGEAVPVLDGNVARVLCRLEALELPDDQNLPDLKQRAEVFLDRARPGPFNEAMMELGALICVPGDPRCLVCPVAKHCRAHALGLEKRLPLARVRIEKKPLHLACGVVRDGDELLLIRRAEKGLFGGLWELPSVEVDPNAPTIDVKRALQKIGLDARSAKPIATVRRTLTHRLLTMALWDCVATSKTAWREGRFVTEADWPTLGLSTAMRKALEKVTTATR
ncbi:MAG: A/G-specific adenine glycosylase [Myxococcales bacterium]|jgi:A/G-specific adenine glycosylase|nr:A/G-specific adenine glycosylase [Myxococcales bacterium]